MLKPVILEIEIPKELVIPRTDIERIQREISSTLDYRANFFEDKERIPNDLRKVWGMTYQEYLSAGYCKPNFERALRHFEPFDLLQNTHVFLVRNEFGKIIGTKSLTLDSNESSPYTINNRGFYFGIPIDASFRDKLGPYREECQRRNTNMAASWRFIVPGKNRDLSITSSLIEKTIDELFNLDISTLFCEVNPRHQLFYESSLGFEEISRGEDSYLNAPAILLRAYREDIVNAWTNFKNGARRKRTKKLYQELDLIKN